MPRPYLSTAVLGALVALASAPTVRAEPAPEPSGATGKKAIASQYVKAGLSAESAGDLDTALTLYQKAYQQIGRAHV